MICPSYFQELPVSCGFNLDCEILSYRADLLHQIRVCGSSSNCCIFSHLWMSSGTPVYYYLGHTAGMVLGKIVSYDPHIVVLVLHTVRVVDIDFGPLPLANNVHNLALNIHLFYHRVVGMESVAAMHDALVEVDNLVLGVVGIVDTVEAVLLCVGVVFGLMG